MFLEHSTGSITVKAEIEESENQIKTLSDIIDRYEDLSNKLKEHIYAVYLNNANEEIGDELIGLGKLGQASLDIQDIVQTAALVKAGAVILVHNHSSGNTEPTEQDIEATEKIHNLLNQLDVKLLDHVIISQNSHHSMKQHHNGSFK